MILETNFHEPAISIEIKKVTEFILLHFGNTVTKYQSWAKSPRKVFKIEKFRNLWRVILYLFYMFPILACVGITKNIVIVKFPLSSFPSVFFSFFDSLTSSLFLFEFTSVSWKTRKTSSTLTWYQLCFPVTLLSSLVNEWNTYFEMAFFR